MSIPFTQYLRPYGTPTDITIDRPPHVEALAREVIDAGYVFEAEVFTTGEVSLTVFDLSEEEDVCIELAGDKNGVPAAVDKLVNDAVRLVRERAAAKETP